MKQGKTQKIDEVVALYLKQMGLSQRFREQEVCRIWPEVVGGMIASHTKSISIVEGKMIVRFTSSVVKNEIRMVRDGLLKALNDRMGERVVTELVIL